MNDACREAQDLMRVLKLSDLTPVEMSALIEILRTAAKRGPVPPPKSPVGAPKPTRKLQLVRLAAS